MKTAAAVKAAMVEVMRDFLRRDGRRHLSARDRLTTWISALRGLASNLPGPLRDALWRVAGEHEEAYSDVVPFALAREAAFEMATAAAVAAKVTPKSAPDAWPLFVTERQAAAGCAAVLGAPPPFRRAPSTGGVL